MRQRGMIPLMMELFYENVMTSFSTKLFLTKNEENFVLNSHHSSGLMFQDRSHAE